jgi:hypothetical protein
VHRAGFWWGTGIGVTAQFFFGGVDWRHRHVKVVHVHNHYVRPLHGRVIRPLQVGKWQHAPVQHRELQRRQKRPAQFVPRARAMPPALSASSPARRVEQPRRMEQPRRVEQTRAIEQPRRVEQPRVIEQPRRVEQPRVIAQPRRVEQPRVIAQPRRVEQPRVIAQPRRVEAPRAQPRPHAQPRPAVQAPRQETRPAFRAQPRGPEGGRGGGWGRQAERNGRRG